MWENEYLSIRRKFRDVVLEKKLSKKHLTNLKSKIKLCVNI